MRLARECERQSSGGEQATGAEDYFVEWGMDAGTGEGRRRFAPFSLAADLETSQARDAAVLKKHVLRNGSVILEKLAIQVFGFF